jgi:PAS domain S-box-containing protein
MEKGPEGSQESTDRAGEFPAETADLRKQLRDLVAMLVLPAVWSGRDTSRILEALLDVLRSMLRLDVAYVRAQDPANGGNLEIARVQESDSATSRQAIANIVDERLARLELSEPSSLPHPVTGELLQAAQTALTIEGGNVVVVAASRRPGFPTPFERFLLQSAVTQAEIALRNAGLNEQLERRVAERTRELTAVNEQLRTEILERRRAEEDLARVHRNLQTLYQCNQALVLATEENDLLRSICRILVEVAGLRMAWVGYRELDEKKSVRVIAWAGFEEGFLNDVDITWADTKRGQGPTGTAIRTGRPTWTRDVQTDFHVEPWRTKMLERGYASSIALPLIADGDVFGALALYAEKPDAFNERTLEQFTELANNLAYGVIALRTREERKRSEQALGRSERQFRALFEEAPVGIALLDSAGRTFKSNRKLQEMLGFSAGELCIKPFTAFTHPDDVAADWSSFTELVSGKRDHYQMEKRYLRKDGVLVWGSLTVYIVRDLQGEPMFGIGMVEDITERKRAEDALRRTQAALAHVTRVTTIGELTASIAHEVNQPLAAVVTNAQASLRWLAGEKPELGEARAAVERIVRDGNRASEVIRRIRAFATRAEPKKGPLDINEVIHEVVGLVQGEAHRHEVALRADLSPTLAPVLGDRVQLQQVILNLVINGIEATAAVSDRPREVLVRSRPHDHGDVLVAVQDSGIGIDKELGEKLFTSFFTTKPAGMGMGLSISRSIVDAHGGRLWAASNQGPGATFQFTLQPYQQGAP